MQERFNIGKSLNVIQPINRGKDKNHLIISTDAVKFFYKIQHLFMIKALMKPRIEGMYLNTIKATYDKPIGNFILNGENLKPFPLKQEQDMVSTLSTLIQHSFDIHSQSNETGRRNKRNCIGKEEIKQSLFGDDMILYLKVSKNPPKDTINCISTVAGYKINSQKSVVFLYNNNELIEKKYRKTIPFTTGSKKLNI
jgi:hypothetical protein